MRYSIFILFFILSFVLRAEEFVVFEKDGYFGIKDETGNVTVPAVYERLGWSNGSTEISNGVIGFREGNLWGLITAKNKALTGQKFYTIEPILNGYFKASIKGKFSNHLFHGILDERGKTVVSFNYFSIESLGANWLVSSFDGSKQQFGVVSFENNLIVPMSYATIVEDNDILLATQRNQKLDFYQSNGKLIQQGLDSIRRQNGWVAFRDGYAGFLSELGKEIYGFDYKGFAVEKGEVRPIDYPTWTIYKQDSIVLKWKCDSLSLGSNDLLVAYLNGANHLIVNNKALIENHELVLKGVIDDNLIVQNSKTRKWTIFTDNGKKITANYDSIISIKTHFGCLNEKGWYLVNKEGEQVNRFPLQSVKSGLGNQFIVKRNMHWGIQTKEKQATYKYDSIVATERGYLVSYLNRWGLLDKKEEWIVRSEFNEVLIFGELIFGRRGRGYTVISQGKELYKTAFKPKSILRNYIIVEGDSSKVGLMNQYGEIVIEPEFQSIDEWGGYFELVKHGEVALMNSSLQPIISLEEGYQDINGAGEEYFVVRKEDRWGFVDSQGRLRISNRYDAAKPFSEGMAPVKLRGKWGFIDKDEKIRIQPYYDIVTPFQESRSVVVRSNKYGLVNENGDEVLELIWESIQRLSTGNYLVRDMDGRYGLVDENGSFIFRPSFDYLEDFRDRVLVFKNGSWGVFNYSGHPIFKINNKEIKVIGDFTIVRS